MLVIFNRQGLMIGFSEGGILHVQGAGHDQDKLHSWINNGIPATQGTLVGPTIVDSPIVRRPGDPWYWQSVLEAVEEEGWKIERVMV